MSPRLLLLCPGQGGQHPGMNALASSDAGAAAWLDAVAGPNCPAADQGALFDNRVAQPAVVSATLAMWLALRQRLASLPLAPSLVAGYSVGELSAYAVAGALDAAATVALAGRRARLMDAAAKGESEGERALAGASGAPQTLAAIAALPLARAASLAAIDDFAIAIVNGHDSCIAGGPLAGLPALRARVEAAGGRLQALPVTVAAHTAHLAPAVAPFAALLEAAAWAPQRCAVLAGVDAGAIGGPAAAPAQARSRAIDTLARQLAETIDWAGCMDAAAESGITVALELGPGAALARMLQARHPQIACRSVADFRSIDGILAWLARQL